MSKRQRRLERQRKNNSIDQKFGKLIGTNYTWDNVYKTYVNLAMAQQKKGITFDLNNLDTFIVRTDVFKKISSLMTKNMNSNAFNDNRKMMDRINEMAPTPNGAIAVLGDYEEIILYISYSIYKNKDGKVSISAAVDPLTQVMFLEFSTSKGVKNVEDILHDLAFLLLYNLLDYLNQVNGITAHTYIKCKTPDNKEVQISALYVTTESDKKSLISLKDKNITWESPVNVLGHWRRSRCKTIKGKDENGERNQDDKTWVNQFSKGAPLQENFEQQTPVAQKETKEDTTMKKMVYITERTLKLLQSGEGVSSLKFEKDGANSIPVLIDIPERSIMTTETEIQDIFKQAGLASAQASKITQMLFERKENTYQH